MKTQVYLFYLQHKLRFNQLNNHTKKVYVISLMYFLKPLCLVRPPGEQIHRLDPPVTKYQVIYHNNDTTIKNTL